MLTPGKGGPQRTGFQVLSNVIRGKCIGPCEASPPPSLSSTSSNQAGHPKGAGALADGSR